jgi:hypothetical protein
MPRYINTRGNTTLGIGICGRCSIKMPLDKLMPDANSPGLMVCEKDRDEYDPYRLPARQPDNIVLQFTRPDTPIGTDPAGVITQDGDYFLIDENGEEYLLP